MSGFLSHELWIKAVPFPYNSSQIARYLSRIGIEVQLCEDGVLLEGPQGALRRLAPTLDNLSRVMRGHLLAFPWENTAMHYTESRDMEVSPDRIWRRFMDEGKGSYCFGQNMLLLCVLRGLGYRAYSGAARVNRHHGHPDKAPQHGALHHAVIFVQMQFPSGEEGGFFESNATYVVDVGFGIMNLARPIPLTENATVPGAFRGEVHRLVRAPSPQSSLEVPRDVGVIHNRWNLEVAYTSAKGPEEGTPWHRLYSFTEDEFQQADYDAASFSVSHMPGPGPFWNSVVCTRSFLDDATLQEGDEAQGDEHRDILQLTLAGKEVRRRSSRGTEVVRAIGSEDERVRVLAEMFGIVILPEDAAHIQGRAAALR